MLKTAAIQLNSRGDKTDNLRQIVRLVGEVVAREAPDWILLPEHFGWLGDAGCAPRVAEPMDGGFAYRTIRELAVQHGVWIHAGSLYEHATSGKVFNTTVVFNRRGREAARYRKIHLFDATLPDGARRHESATVIAGRDLVTYDCEGVTVGCATGYDLRFPDLFQALVARGAQVIALPAAFTVQTGRDHWELLLRARAVETQAWWVAANQWGSHETSAGQADSYGRSMIVDPWGRIRTEAPEGAGAIAATFDPALAEEVRGQIPVRWHRTFGKRALA